MKDVTKNEMSLILTIFKSPEKDYNARTIAKEIKITHMGALKIVKRLENEGILKSKELGKAKFYTLNFDNDYVEQYLKFLLKREVEQSNPYVKRWIKEIKKIKNADSAILFGSILIKHKKAKDIDTLFIIDSKKFSKLKDEITKINSINIKKLHPIYQTKQDIKDNIKEGDKPLLNAIKGIIIFGDNTIINLLRK